METKNSSKMKNSSVCMVFVFTGKELRMSGERTVLTSKHNIYRRQTLDQARTGPFNGSMGTTSPG